MRLPGEASAELEGELTAGRAALERGAWEEARALFEEDVRRRETPEALEGLATAVRWLFDGEAAWAANERAYRLYRERSDARGAGRVASALALLAYNLRREEAGDERLARACPQPPRRARGRAGGGADSRARGARRPDPAARRGAGAGALRGGDRPGPCERSRRPGDDRARPRRPRSRHAGRGRRGPAPAGRGGRRSRCRRRLRSGPAPDDLLLPDLRVQARSRLRPCGRVVPPRAGDRAPLVGPAHVRRLPCPLRRRTGLARGLDRRRGGACRGDPSARRDHRSGDGRRPGTPRRSAASARPARRGRDDPCPGGNAAARHAGAWRAGARTRRSARRGRVRRALPAPRSRRSARRAHGRAGASCAGTDRDGRAR